MRSLRVLALVGTIVALSASALPVQAGTDSARIDPALARELRSSTGAVGAFVHFAPSVGYGAAVDVVTASGLRIGADLPAGHLAFAYGAAASFEEVATAPEVTFLEHAGTEPLLMETASWATRSRTLYETTGGLDLRVRDSDGDLLDGAGVGIAIVDSGVDATHPDLTWHEKTVRNFKVLCGAPDLSDAGCDGNVVMEDVPDSDTTSGHGSHVAGISAGDGTASDSDDDPSTTGDRMFRGVAPGAKLYGFGAGEGLNILVPSAAAAFQWISDNADNPCAPDPADPVACPPIRVVNNSWGGTGAHNPDLAISKLSNALVEQGITVVFAAGNSGGDGSTISTNPYANNPTPGVISVANYFDDDEGNRDAALDSSSSRGKADQPETWPDVSAPGFLITSTCRPTKPVCAAGGVASPAYPGNYTILAGTSMAAPHTAGVASFLYQADPGITPAEVEDVLEDTAHKFTAGAAYEPDPANPDDTSSFDKGHGLVDARLSALEVSGLPADHGTEPEGAAANPSVSIDAPTDGARVKRLFTAHGTADTGGGSTVTTVIASGDGGDYSAVDSQDLVEARLTEDVLADTVRFDWQVRGTTTPPAPGTSFRYWMFTSIDGVARRLGVTWTGTATTISDESPAACSAAKDGNVFSLTCPAASLGATQGAVLFDVFAATFRAPGLVFGGIAKGQGTEDVAPGGLGVTSLELPERGEEHVFVGQLIDPPAGRVFLSLDGGAPQLAGSGTGHFTWHRQMGPARPGPHTLTAVLRIDGEPVASDTITVFKGHD